jgi:hypothetical protein
VETTKLNPEQVHAVLVGRAVSNATVAAVETLFEMIRTEGGCDASMKGGIAAVRDENRQRLEKWVSGCKEDRGVLAGEVEAARQTVDAIMSDDVTAAFILGAVTAVANLVPCPDSVTQITIGAED